MMKPSVVQMLWHMPVDFSGSIEKVGLAIARNSEGFRLLTIGKQRESGEWPGELSSWAFPEARRRWKFLDKLLGRPAFPFPDLVRRLDETKPDIVHFHVRHVWVDPLIERLSYRPKVVVHYHGSNTVQLDQLTIHVPRTADVLIAVSDAMKNRIHQAAGPQQPVVSVHNPVPDWAFEAGRDRQEKRANPVPVLLYCGGKRKAKGYEELRSAVRQLAQPFRLWVAGPDLDGEDWQDDRVEILGRLPPDQLRSRMLAADAVVMPSTSEPLGLVALEALATKRLLVASSADGLGEIVDPQAAVVVAPASSASLADGLSRALGLLGSDPARCAAMAEAGREHIENNFSSAAFGKKIADVYWSLLK